MYTPATTSTPHDAIFRQLLSCDTIARDFIQLHLPSEFLKICQLDSLKLESGSFIEENLRACNSDVLYSLNTQYGMGYVYVLIEHQSTADPHMAFRLMRYAVAVMQRHLDAGNTRLPLVVPVLYYAGKRTPYPYSNRWLDGFEDPELASKVYNRDFPLVDVTTMPDAEIATQRKMAALTFLHKHVKQRDLMQVMDDFVAILQRHHITATHFRRLIQYMLSTSSIEDVDAVLATLAEKLPQRKETLMTLAEQLIAKGERIGSENLMLVIAQKMLDEGEEQDRIIRLTGIDSHSLAGMVADRTQAAHDR
ncbi:Rpn family recombination-promoting nuclease/putative transposase [Candidatus Pantoea multigeneris]|uniref:Rpn family recombination-promoting nuclease/putative transposase n=1 Tax=Candidatus Pantoea multigeneris TaxID=2608357 RepID=A0ABX0RA59_9GAMM|nr:Rpn family recombination-promoting nuclease/putative transposase [Pantoea multigeneris]NIF22252.1 Rpn family recombination-promoting nuclease/putative transposase [Pantoea multigeneris]